MYYKIMNFSYIYFHLVSWNELHLVLLHVYSYLITKSVDVSPIIINNGEVPGSIQWPSRTYITCLFSCWMLIFLITYFFFIIHHINKFQTAVVLKMNIMVKYCISLPGEKMLFGSLLCFRIYQFVHSLCYEKKYFFLNLRKFKIKMNIIN